MTLKLYRQKRDFKITNEPIAKISKKIKNLYVIQKHAASRLHYDFRIALNGVLKSWAIPKGPNLDPAVKRLAVHVEDHPIEYGSFEGIIPQGQYGGGTVMLWDTGEWECIDHDANSAYKKGNLTFNLKGKKLKGTWKLIRINKDPKNWLLIKVEDRYAIKENEYNILEKMSNSVKTERSLEEIARAQTKVSTPKKASKMPKKIRPALATLVKTPPKGNDWLHEVKYDGYRLLSFIRNNKVVLMTRNQNNWTKKFPYLVNELKKQNLRTAILDGEIVMLNNELHSDFQLLQNSIHEKDTSTLIYYVFDLIYIESKNLSGLPLFERKKILRTIIHNTDIIQYSDHFIGKGVKFFKESCQLGLEGIVSKNIYSTYQQKRTQEWVKTKCVKRQEFVVVGFTKPKGKRQYFGSLLLAINTDNHELKYVGHVGTGFSVESLKNLHKLLSQNESQMMPLLFLPTGIRSITWVKPNIIVEIEFSEWTQEGLLRHPSFKGIRSDKNPHEITREMPRKVTMKKSIDKTSYKLTNSNKILYPEDNITKQDLANYYFSIHQWILPHIIKRPLTLVRCPNTKEKCFYQKHLKDIPDNEKIYSMDIQEKQSLRPYLYIKDVAGLMALVQLNVLEIHPWGCHIDKIEKPDVLIFDLDPAPDVEWNEVIKAAFFVKENLEEHHLKSFVKTTGGKGLHVTIPLQRHYEWNEIEIFAHTFADFAASLKPDLYIANMNKAKRKGKIFIDYLRNQRGATAVAPYSTRARGKAPVSTPLRWEELSVKIKPDHYTMDNVLTRLKNLISDPWEDFFLIKQKLKLPKW